MNGPESSWLAPILRRVFVFGLAGLIICGVYGGLEGFGIGIVLAIWSTTLRYHAFALGTAYLWGTFSGAMKCGVLGLLLFGASAPFGDPHDFGRSFRKILVRSILGMTLGAIGGLLVVAFVVSFLPRSLPASARIVPPLLFWCLFGGQVIGAGTGFGRDWNTRDEVLNLMLKESLFPATILGALALIFPASLLLRGPSVVVKSLPVSHWILTFGSAACAGFISVMFGSSCCGCLIAARAGKLNWRTLVLAQRWGSLLVLPALMAITIYSFQQQLYLPGDEWESAIHTDYFNLEMLQQLASPNWGSWWMPLWVPALSVVGHTFLLARGYFAERAGKKSSRSDV